MSEEIKNKAAAEQQKPAAKKKASSQKKQAANGAEPKAVKEQSRTVKNQVKKTTKKVRVSVPLLNVRKEPTITSEVLRVVEKGAEFVINAHVYGFGKLANEGGYVHLDFVELLPSENQVEEESGAGE